MGFFSWITSDTKRSVANIYSTREVFPVYVLCPDGSTLYEESYEGYGVFQGKDIYALLAEWNSPEKCSGDVDQDRIVGINLTFDRPHEIKHPIIILEKPPVEGRQYEPSETCPFQGFFYSDEYEEEEDWGYYEDWDEDDDYYEDGYEDTYDCGCCKCCGCDCDIDDKY